MGTITKTVASGWLDRIEVSRQQLIEAAKTGNRVLAAFAQADARAELIESLKDPEVSARLLKITDPELAMVELANNPTNDDRIRICAIAILSGFVPGDDQFAIFGGGKTREGNSKPGKLYTKEAGYRTLFGHLGIVPEVSIGYPEFLPLGESGKKVWRVPAAASCEHNGQSYAVTFGDKQENGVDNRVTLPGYDSDNPAGIAAKARRRVLQALWCKLSPVLNEPQADDDELDVVHVDEVPKQITQQPETESKSVTTSQPVPLTAAEQHRATGQAIIRMLSSDPSAASTAEEIWKAMTAAKTASSLTTICDEYRPLLVGFSESIQAKFRKYKAALLREMTDAEGLSK